VAEHVDVEALGLLDGLEGDARAQRAELIEWLLERNISVDQIRDAFAPMLLATRRVVGDDDATYVSAREIGEKAGIDLDFLQPVQRAMGLPRVDDPDAAVHMRAMVRLLPTRRSSSSSASSRNRLCSSCGCLRRASRVRPR
jgi:adenylate cyclase